MADLTLPADLVEFLRAGKQLEYDPATCEAGAVTLLPPDRLKVELFPMDCQSTEVEEQDPHNGELGCYLVEGVNLVAACTGGYEPAGLLLWLPREKRYATWDDSHCVIRVFGPEVDWSRIVEAPARHINAQWADPSEDAPPTSCLVPWPRYAYSAEQVYEPLPDLAEWYAARWHRIGASQEEIRVRVERDGDRREITGQVMAMDGAGDWHPASAQTRPLTPAEWEQLGPWLEAGFWRQPRVGTAGPGIPTSSWWFEGYRGGCYHTLCRFFGDGGSEAKIVDELGARLAGLAGLRRFEAQE